MPQEAAKPAEAAEVVPQEPVESAPQAKSVIELPNSETLVGARAQFQYSITGEPTGVQLSGELRGFNVNDRLSDNWFEEFNRSVQTGRARTSDIALAREALMAQVRNLELHQRFLAGMTDKNSAEAKFLITVTKRMVQSITERFGNVLRP